MASVQTEPTRMPKPEDEKLNPDGTPKAPEATPINWHNEAMDGINAAKDGVKQMQAPTPIDSGVQPIQVTVERPVMADAPTVAFDPAGLANKAPSVDAFGNQQVAQVQRTQVSDEFKNNQSALINQLMLQTQGQGPSLAQSQFQQSTDQNVAAMMAAQASQRGGYNAATARNVQNQFAGTQQQAAIQAADLRAKEQLAAQSLVGAIAGQAREGDLKQGQISSSENLAQAQIEASAFQTSYDAAVKRGLTNAQIASEFGLKEADLLYKVAETNATLKGQKNTTEFQGNVQLSERQAQIDSQAALAAQALTIDVQKFNVEQKVAYDRLVQDLSAKYAAMGLDFASSLSKAENDAKMAVAAAKQKSGGADWLGSVLTVAGAAMSKLGGGASSQKPSKDAPTRPPEGEATTTFEDSGEESYGSGDESLGGEDEELRLTSDKRAKKEIKPASNSFYEFLDTLQGSEYKYKSSNEPQGKQFGIMAQELEKSEIGKNFVKDTPEGKKVEFTPSSFGAMLAAQAELHARLKKLEGNKK